ncbi:MAG: threonine synthase [Caldisericia bacterium]|nr:threonine synthase [Caldisericia bacterium]
MKRVLRCFICKKEYDLFDLRIKCDCGGPLEIFIKEEENLSSLKDIWEKRLSSKKKIDQSGVWRYRELVFDLEEKEIITYPEGKTNLYEINNFYGLNKIYIKHEGENPTGSFKDRGMTVGVSIGKKLGFNTFICASTGNTSSSLAAYSSLSKSKCIVLIPKGKVALGKLSQVLSFGANIFEIEGDFDDAMRIVKDISSKYKIYLLNSLNPIRLEGQKTIIIDSFFFLNWEIPDWIIVPGGNLGNSSSFGKVLFELFKFKIIDKIPKIAVIQALKASPFYNYFKSGFKEFIPQRAETVATAIRIGNPVNIEKARFAIEFTKGVVEVVSDEEILKAKIELDSLGFGCEPSSAATVAGLKKLIQNGIIKKGEIPLLILTGNMLKDPNIVIEMSERFEEIKERIVTVKNEKKEIERKILNVLEVV